MPELPEVETIRKDLEKQILKKKIKRVVVKDKRLIGGNLKIFQKILNENYFTKLDRIGKLLIFNLNGGKDYLLVHLKMTGQLIYCRQDKCIAGGHGTGDKVKIPGIDEKLPNKHTRAVLQFIDGSQLFFNDLRRFGYFRIVDRSGLEKEKEKFGPEPLTRDFTPDVFVRAIKGKKTNIKPLLLNQKITAGIGNIYADEILFDAGVMPNRKVSSLSKKEIKKIFQSINKIIKKGIKYRGTTFSNYVDGRGQKGNFLQFLKVYKREGEKCRSCQSIIRKIKIGGRTTRYCPRCQF